jgi:hypothetical protein
MVWQIGSGESVCFFYGMQRIGWLFSFYYQYLFRVVAVAGR